MKNTKLEIVRYLFGVNLIKSNDRIISKGNKNVNIERKKSKRYKQYF